MGNKGKETQKMIQEMRMYMEDLGERGKEKN